MTVKISDVLTEEAVRQRMEAITQEDLQFRKAFRPLDATGINSSTFNVPRPKDTIGLPSAIPEGAEFPRDEEDYEKVTIDFAKYGFEVALTMEAMEDSMIDVKADQMERQGRQMQEKLNELAFKELDANLNANADPSGGTQVNTPDSVLSYSDIVALRQELKGDGYKPDLLLVDIEGETDLLTDSNFIHATDLGDKTLTEGAIGRIAGLDVVTTDAGHISGDGTPTAYVVDTDFYGYEATRAPVSTHTYHDDERQADIMQIWVRKGFKAIDASAAGRVDG